MSASSERPAPWQARLPFYYGWVVVGVAFTTMAIGVNARTAFSLLYPAILDEFGWAHGATAGIFAVGFLASLLVTPFVGTLMERFGPHRVIPAGALVVASGLAAASRVDSLIGLSLTLGALTVGGSVVVSYIGHASFLPNWFVKRRGLVMGLTFSGVGVGGFVLFPLLEQFIAEAGWREACLALAALIVVVIVPLNFLLARRRPQDLGLEADGDVAAAGSGGEDRTVRDTTFASIDWTYARIVREPRFWFVALAYFCSLYNHYAVQVHQTRFLIESGFSMHQGAMALAFVVLLGIPGQIAVGWLSDRIGREAGWAIAMTGYVCCFMVFLSIDGQPSLPHLYAAVAFVGLMGAGTAPLFGAIGAELFGGPGYGRVFGLLGVAISVGAATGAWATGALRDLAGSYETGFSLCIVLAALSAYCIYRAAPGSVRPVSGRR